MKYPFFFFLFHFLPKSTISVILCVPWKVFLNAEVSIS